jgi:hypothetical protein
MVKKEAAVEAAVEAVEIVVSDEAVENTLDAVVELAIASRRIEVQEENKRLEDELAARRRRMILERREPQQVPVACVLLPVACRLSFCGLRPL